MTKVEKIFEKERIEYGIAERYREKAITAKRMLDLGMDIIKVTGLSEQEIHSLQDDKTTV